MKWKCSKTQILHPPDFGFLWFYAFFVQSQPNALKNNIAQILHFSGQCRWMGKGGGGGEACTNYWGSPVLCMFLSSLVVSQFTDYTDQPFCIKPKPPCSCELVFLI